MPSRTKEINSVKEQIKKNTKTKSIETKKEKTEEDIKQKSTRKKRSESTTKTTNKAAKNEIQLTINENTNTYEINVKTNNFKIVMSDDEGYQVYVDKSKSYIIANRPNLKINCKKTYVSIKKIGDQYKIETNNNLNIDGNIQAEGLSKEKEVLSFYNSKVKEIYVKDKALTIEEKNSQNQKIESNNTLLISEILGKVCLPYTEEQIREELIKEEGATIEDIVEKVFIKPISYYKHTIRTRYKEGYNLMHNKEGKSVRASIMLGLELMFEFNLNPAIITACRNLEELDIYLDCLEDNELEKFSCFKIKYQAMPVVENKKAITMQKI